MKRAKADTRKKRKSPSEDQTQENPNPDFSPLLRKVAKHIAPDLSSFGFYPMGRESMHAEWERGTCYLKIPLLKHIPTANGDILSLDKVLWLRFLLRAVPKFDLDSDDLGRKFIDGLGNLYQVTGAALGGYPFVEYVVLKSVSEDRSDPSPFAPFISTDGKGIITVASIEPLLQRARKWECMKQLFIAREKEPNSPFSNSNISYDLFRLIFGVAFSVRTPFDPKNKISPYIHPSKEVAPTTSTHEQWKYDLFS